MKKIVSMLAIGALTLGCLFADVSLAFTGKAAILSDNGNLNLRGYTKTLAESADIEENVKFTAKNDYAGVVFQIKPSASESNTTWFATKEQAKLDQYYGWMNFGNLKVQAGVWESRSVARLTDEADKWEGTHYETVKPGIMKDDADNKTFGNAVDAFNLTEKTLATQLTYAGGFGSISAAIVSNDNYGGKINTKSGLAAEGKFKLSNGNLVIAWRNTKANDFSLGTSVDIKNDKMTAMGAVTWATGNKIGVDLRARIPFGDGFMFTTMNNLTKNGSLMLWDMLSVSYNVADNVKAMATLEFENRSIGSDDTNNAIRIIPSVKYSVSKKSYATAGVIIQISGLCFAGCELKHPATGMADTKIAVPLILHVEM